MKSYQYYVVIYNGEVYKDTIIESKEFIGCTFIEKDKFLVNGRSDCEGLILRVNANKRLLEENLRMNPIDIPKIIKLRFSPFPSVGVEDNGNSKVKTLEQTELKPQPSLDETDAGVSENASVPRLKLRSGHKPETTRKRKLEVATHEKSSSTDKKTEKSGISKKNKVEEDQKKEAEVKNIVDDSDDLSIHKKYKVYKRKSPNPDCNIDKKMPEQEAEQENVPITSESSDVATTDELTPQPRHQDTEMRNEIEAAPKNNNNFDKQTEIDEQLQTIPEVNSYECTEPEDKIFPDEIIRMRSCLHEYNKLFVNYEKLKKRYRQLNRSNMLLFQYITNLCRSSRKILKNNKMSSLPRYIPGATAGLGSRAQFSNAILTIESDDSISDCNSDDINFIE